MKAGVQPRHLVYAAIQRAMPFGVYVDIEDVKLAAIPAVSPLDALEKGRKIQANSRAQTERRRQRRIAAGNPPSKTQRMPQATDDDLIRMGARVIVTQALTHLYERAGYVIRDGDRVRRVADFANPGAPALRLIEGGEAASG